MPGPQSDCDDCGASFPLQVAAEHGGLCRKCKRLAPLTLSSEKYKEILVRFFNFFKLATLQPLPPSHFKSLHHLNDRNGSSVASVVILDEIWFHVSLARFRHVEVNNALH